MAMSRMGSWLTTKHKLNASTQSLNSLAEPQYLEDAMRAATYILNDDVDAAEAGLSKGNSSFHKLGRGVVTFIKATLGFEQDVMREASERLAEAEATAASDQRRAQRDSHTYHSPIYSAGSEFALCHAQSQLMGAVVGVLNENLTEMLKSLYKLRKAYMTLSALADAEEKYTSQKHRNTFNGGASHDIRIEPKTAEKPVKEGVSTASITQEYGVPSLLDAKGEGDDDGDEEFFDVEETPESLASKQDGTDTVDNHLTKQLSGLNFAPTKGHRANELNHNAQGFSDADTFLHPIDIFIHSGVGLCFGMLLLMISMIPPAFGKVLHLIGFKGDRERGLKMLWNASKYSNINGAMAGLCLLTYYNGIVGFCDIVAEDDTSIIGDYPARRCEELLTQMRGVYPRSRLWLLEEARMHAMNRDLERSVQMLSGDIKTPLKQIEALAMFEKSLNSIYLHDYEMATESFVKCVDLNSWSHALYFFVAGSSQVELYRKYRSSDANKARHHAKMAEEYLRMVPSHAGKKKFMARQLPFDVFVARKVAKWDQRAKDWGVDFVDAVGVSPIEEMIYFWNGYKRMKTLHLHDSLTSLDWSTHINPHWRRETLDEHAIHALLRATTLRNLSQLAEARQILQDQILAHAKAEFKGPLKDDWTCPAAHYEMAVVCWMERKAQRTKEGRDARVRECGDWLEKAARWDSYDLDTRIGLKVTTAQNTLKRYHQTP